MLAVSGGSISQRSPNRSVWLSMQLSLAEGASISYHPDNSARMRGSVGGTKSLVTHGFCGADFLKVGGRTGRVPLLLSFI